MEKFKFELTISASTKEEAELLAGKAQTYLNDLVIERLKGGAEALDSLEKELERDLDKVFAPEKEKSDTPQLRPHEKEIITASRRVEKVFHILMRFLEDGSSVDKVAKNLDINA